MKFYEAVLSSAAFRVRIALHLKGLAYDSVVFDLRANQHLTEEYRKVNPIRTVPSLELLPGQTLFESMAIIEYLEETHPEPPLLPADPLAKARVRAMAQLVACEIHPLNNLRVLRYLSRELKIDESGRDRWYAHWIQEGFQALESLLPDSGSFSYGSSPTLADLFLIPQVANALRYKVDISAYPRIRHIYDSCMQLPAFSLSHPDHHMGK
ncbi:MAG TPA: maleylacetoacetate isomerase [Myxococcales bacterium]|nr:maleylacetoacetate isomerase [Myxococcales bacterium]